jgi:hypothetical protein
VFSLVNGLPSTPSANGHPLLFERFTGITPPGGPSFCTAVRTAATILAWSAEGFVGLDHLPRQVAKGWQAIRGQLGQREGDECPDGTGHQLQ